MGRKPTGPGLWERPHTKGYTWTTYPERLEAAGVTWKLYQGGTGEPGTPTDNYTDNSLEFFSAFHPEEGADPDGPLMQKGVTDHTLKDLRDDVLAGRLAQVNWIVAPYKYCEHPEASPTDGAYYIHKVLEALTADPQVWSRTVLFLNYDENDGLFDHVIPPMPPASNGLGAQGMVSSDLAESLPDEFIDLDLYPNEEHPLIPGHIDRGLQPIGLGPRVPMIIASPWTRGGWVCSETFDHTSVLRFLEVRFGVHEPNITAWRRSVCGDLTSAFDFSNAADPFPVSLSIPTRAVSKQKPYRVPAKQSIPVQETGDRPARALPYQFIVNGRSDGKQFWIHFENQGKAAAAFQVQDRVRFESAPRRYAVSSGTHLSDSWQPATRASDYDLIVYGPNGFLRQFRGSASDDALEVEISYVAGQPALELSINNHDKASLLLTATEAYSGSNRKFSIPPGGTQQIWDAAESHGWYDLSLSTEDQFLRRFAGHIETGQPSVSDPALSAAFLPFAGMAVD
ncbi:MAG TPA: alkaline phosphatase family protein [Acidobacteriaceae bacterium]|nr:alkaline phosphatase family protein [Acidobacteriaceae bacterium]